MDIMDIAQENKIAKKIWKAFVNINGKIVYMEVVDLGHKADPWLQS